LLGEEEDYDDDNGLDRNEVKVEVSDPLNQNRD
jgi:hypothetical protein